MTSSKGPVQFSAFEPRAFFESPVDICTRDERAVGKQAMLDEVVKRFKETSLIEEELGGDSELSELHPTQYFLDGKK